METVLDIGRFALPGAYLVCLALYVRHFFGASDTDIFVGSWVYYASLALHAVFLTLRGLHTEHIPFATTGEFFSLLALSVGVTYAAAERWHREANTGIFFVAIVLVFQAYSSWTLGDPGPITSSRGLLYGVHVVFTIVGFAGFTVSALYALMYILLSHQLKSRELGVIFRRLPPLNTLEQMSRLATTTGIVLFGIGLGLGHVVAYRNFDALAFLLQPTIIVAHAAWLGYFLGLVVAKRRDLSGIEMGYCSVGGYVAFMTAIAVVLTRFGAFHAFQ